MYCIAVNFLLFQQLHHATANGRTAVWQTFQLRGEEQYIQPSTHFRGGKDKRRSWNLNSTCQAQEILSSARWLSLSWRSGHWQCHGYQSTVQGKAIQCSILQLRILPGTAFLRCSGKACFWEELVTTSKRLNSLKLLNFEHKYWEEHTCWWIDEQYH